MIHVITEQDVELHRLALIAWAETNGLNPQLIDPNITVEQVGDRQVIHYNEHQVDVHGAKLVDPHRADHVLKIHRSRTLRHPLPEGIGRRLCTCTLGELDPACTNHPAATQRDQTPGG